MSKIEIDLEKVTKELDELKDTRARYNFELKQVEKQIDERESLLGLFLKQSDLQSCTFGRYEFYFKESSRTAFDQAAFKKDYPELFQKYRLTKTKEDFEFKIV